VPRLTGILIVGCFVVATVSCVRGADDLPSQYEAGEVKVPAARTDEPVIKLSIEKASQHLDHGAVAWSKQKNCVSCHTNGTYLFIRPALTPSLGAPLAETRGFFVDQLATLSKLGARKLRRSGTQPAQVIYIAAGLAEWDAHVTKKLSPETDEALRLAFELQNKEGTWHSLTCWPPFESSAYQEAHMAAMAVAAAPGWVESIREDDELRVKIDLLKKYVGTTELPHDYARVLQLWTSLRLDGILNPEQQLALVKLLREKQKTDGGWSIRQFATPEQWGSGNRAGKLREEPEFTTQPSDGHMTGLALLVLQEAGVSADDDALRRGLTWLRENQRESGRWWTRSLNTDKWHFITYSGTAYPLLALQRASVPRVTTD
jgi:squalene-hopene/tetraprenyl-beta-curcumene cyclase